MVLIKNNLQFLSQIIVGFVLALIPFVAATLYATDISDKAYLYLYIYLQITLGSLIFPVLAITIFYSRDKTLKVIALYCILNICFGIILATYVCVYELHSNLAWITKLFGFLRSHAVMPQLLSDGGPFAISSLDTGSSSVGSKGGGNSELPIYYMMENNNPAASSSSGNSRQLPPIPGTGTINVEGSGYLIKKDQVRYTRIMGICVSGVDSLWYSGTASDKVKAGKLADLFQAAQRNGISKIAVNSLKDGNSTQGTWEFLTQIYENQGVELKLKKNSIMLTDKLITTIRKG